MCALAHVIEKAGIATVTLASTLSVAERMKPPRALWADFPLGRPLGHPQDAAFQHDVLRRAFALLDESVGPVLVHHPMSSNPTRRRSAARSHPPTTLMRRLRCRRSAVYEKPTNGRSMLATA